MILVVFKVKSNSICNKNIHIKRRTDLCHFLQEEGHEIVVYQPFPGIQQPFTKQYKGITFFMIPNNGGWEYNTCADLNWQFNEYAALSDLRIYFATFLAFPNAISPCITISHGIYWDNTQGVNTIQTLTESQRKEYFRRQLYGFTATDICVSVDYFYALLEDMGIKVR